MGRKRRDLTGLKVGRLTVISFEEKRGILHNGRKPDAAMPRV